MHMVCFLIVFLRTLSDKAVLYLEYMVFAQTFGVVVEKVFPSFPCFFISAYCKKSPQKSHFCKKIRKIKKIPISYGLFAFSFCQKRKWDLFFSLCFVYVAVLGSTVKVTMMWADMVWVLYGNAHWVWKSGFLHRKAGLWRNFFLDVCSLFQYNSSSVIKRAVCLPSTKEVHVT